MHKLIQVVLFVSLLCGCRNGFFGSKKQLSDDGDVGPDKEIIDFSDLENSVPTEISTLISSYSSMDEQGVMGYVGFYGGRRYLSATVKKLDSKNYQLMAVVGNYQLIANALQVKGKRGTCPQAVKSDYKILGTPASPSLTVTHNNTTVNLPRTEKAFDVSEGLVLQWGCFNQNGVFSARKWSAL